MCVCLCFLSQGGGGGGGGGDCLPSSHSEQLSHTVIICWVSVCVYLWLCHNASAWENCYRENIWKINSKFLPLDDVWSTYSCSAERRAWITFNWMKLLSGNDPSVWKWLRGPNFAIIQMCFHNDFGVVFRVILNSVKLSGEAFNNSCSSSVLLFLLVGPFWSVLTIILSFNKS